MRQVMLGLAMAAALAGCDMSKMQSMNWGRQAETRPAPPTQQQVDGLKAEVAALKTENAALNERMREVQEREKSLAAKAEKAEFIQQQQAEQIKVLAAVPGERDKALEQVANLSHQVELLKARNAELARTVEVLIRANQAVSSAGTPATAPVVAPTSAPATQGAK